MGAERFDPDEVVAFKPGVCNDCGHQLETGRVKRFYTHQVIEPLEVKPQVTHYELHKTRLHEFFHFGPMSIPGYCPEIEQFVGASWSILEQCGYSGSRGEVPSR